MDDEARGRWLKARQGGIGGSDAPAVMGVSPWRSPYALWAQKTGIEPDALDNEVLRWGRILEGPIADDYSRLTGRALKNLGEHEIQRHAKLPHMICTLDRVIEPIDDRGPGSLSIKYVGPMKAGDWREDAPVDYQVQLQHELAVMGFKWGSFAVLVWGRGVQWLDMERNDAFVEVLEQEESEFWGKVESGNPPPIDGAESTGEAIKRLYPKDDGRLVELPPECRTWWSHAEECKAEIKRFRYLQEENENRIKAALGTASEGFTGEKRWTYRAQSRKGYAVEATEYRVLRESKTKINPRGTLTRPRGEP